MTQQRVELTTEIERQVADIYEMITVLATPEQAHLLADNAVELAGIALRLRDELLHPTRAMARA